MSDLFNEEVPLDFIQRVFKTMNETPHNTYQILTNRSKQLSELAESLHWTPNIWIGTSLENEDVSYRIKDLRKSTCSYSISLT
ncbi:DUF5131 family protein [Peribacillus simplex]|uniref:DUF5131 family protein n=1 Tax=Peribacillus simplex TaxID=1478 RepID=UPI002695EF64